MSKNGKKVESAPATSFAEVAQITGIDQGKIARFAHTGSPHGLKSHDLDKIFTSAGGKQGWENLVVNALHLADEKPAGITVGM